MIALLATLAVAARLATPIEDSAHARREALMQKLKSGGYTVLLRHARTDYSFREQMGTVPAERRQQRNLSDDGIRDAALIGVVFRRYGIGFAEIVASPMFRTIETAEMAAGKPTATTMALRVFPSTPEQEALVKTAPRPGTNRLLVTHHFVIETHVPGVEPGDVQESEAAVVRHAADGTLQLVGLIKLDDWKALANPGGGKAAAAPASTGAVLTHGAPPPTSIHGGPPPKLPDAAVANLAKAYVTAFNSGNPNTMRTFLESSFVADPSRTIEARLESYAKLFADLGPLSLVSVDSIATSSVSLGMSSKRGRILLTMKTVDNDPKRAASLTFAMYEAHR